MSDMDFKNRDSPSVIGVSKEIIISGHIEFLITSVFQNHYNN